MKFTLRAPSGESLSFEAVRASTLLVRILAGANQLRAAVEGRGDCCSAPFRLVLDLDGGRGAGIVLSEALPWQHRALALWLADAVEQLFATAGRLELAEAGVHEPAYLPALSPLSPFADL